MGSHVGCNKMSAILLRCYLMTVLALELVKFRGLSVHFIPNRFLPDSHKDVRSHTEASNGWMTIKRPKNNQGGLALNL